MPLDAARAELRAAADADDAAFLQRFFKTGPGEYAEGDVFMGVRVPQTRVVAKRHRDLSVEECAELLGSPLHEERLLALIVMVAQYRDRKSSEELRQRLFELYMRSTARINNWDLVDTSAEIVGMHTAGDLSVLDRLAASEMLWERRIAILATFVHIKVGWYEPTLRIAERLLGDRHDLIHKAVGWMLREVGNRDRDAEESFLRAHAAAMPRTMLRYAIEKFPEEERKAWMGEKREGRGAKRSEE